MRPSTADAIHRAGLALQLAMDLVEEDDTTPPGLEALLAKLGPLAAKLADVPRPELPSWDPRASEAKPCPSCGTARIVTNLSGPCPVCGQVAPVAHL